MAAYHNIAVTATFVAPTSGNGTLQFSDVLNGAQSVSDVTPNTLPADNANGSNTPLIYISIYNGTSNTIAFGADTPTLTATAARVMLGSRYPAPPQRRAATA